LLIIGIGTYALYEPYRSDSAEEDQQAITIERGAHLFALNCRTCHGDVGQGGSAGGRLGAAPPLDNPELRGLDRLGANFDQSALDEDIALVRGTITCGRAGTSMPTWGDQFGGTLNDEQIRQLTVFITEGDNWDLAQEEANEQDAEATGHAVLAMPGGALSENAPELVLSNAGAFNQGQAIRIGEGATEERMRVLQVPSTGHLLAEEIGRTPTSFQVTGVQAREAHITVERAIQDTAPAAHAAGAEIEYPPEDPEAEDPTSEEAQPQPADAELVEAVAASDEDFVVSSTLRLRVGQVILIDDELMRITELEKAQQQISDGDIVRVESELMRVTGISDDGDTRVALAEPINASATTIDVSDAGRIRQQSVVRIDDELVRVVEAVSTERSLRESIGRAEDRFVVSGLNGIEEGMIIRLEGEQRFTSELMRVLETTPARVRVQRGGTDDDPIETEAHSAGAELVAIEEVPSEDNPDELVEAPEPTGMELVEAIDDGDGEATLIVSGSEGISVDGTIEIDGERMTVLDVEQAELEVERGAEDTEPLTHASGISMFDGNLLVIERGYADTSADSHDGGAELFRFVLDVERAVEDSELAPHSANAELFVGNGLNVERAILGTTAREHENGEPVYNFPEAPSPSTNPGACGQRGGIEVSATPTPAIEAQVLNIAAVPVSQFDTETLTASSTFPSVRIMMDNQDDGNNHNIAVYTDETASDDFAFGPVCTGPCENYIQFEMPEPGTYYFQCDVHPSLMFGDFIVE
jgi:mono/diheme cytochrome c family protein